MAQQQQPVWGNPAAWALFAVAVLTACVGVFYAGLVPGSTAPLLIGILLSCSLPQIIGAIINFRRGEVLFGSIAGLFGTVITLGAAFTLYQQVIQAPAPGAFTPEVMGAFWITLFVITEIFAIGFGHAPYTGFIMAGIAEVGVAFLCLGINALTGSAAAGTIAGVLLILFSAFCIYSAAAIVLGEHFQRPILPLGRPVFK
jgi:succinate-acetate transporter protein